MFLNAHYCIGCPFLKNARSGLCWKYKERVYGLTGFRGVLFKEGPPLWIATGALFFSQPVRPLATEETPHCFLQPQTPPVTRALLGFSSGYGASVEWEK